MEKKNTDFHRTFRTFAAVIMKFIIIPKGVGYQNMSINNMRNRTYYALTSYATSKVGADPYAPIFENIIIEVNKFELTIC